MKNQIAEELIQKYQDGKCSDEEKALLFSWYNQRSNELQDSLDEPDYGALNIRISRGLPTAAKRNRLWTKVAAAASIVLGVTAATLFYNRPAPLQQKAAASTHTYDLAPGGEAATLTLTDGSKISLTNIKEGERVVRSGVEIYKNTKGQLVYKTLEPTGASQTPGHQNTIETPVGGQYQIVLPDGTLVYLNAASTLRFPSVFANDGRNVELSGEAFFDVAEVKHTNRKLPFRVTAENTKIEVLGTQFNVMAYLNEGVQETTLLEGAVQVSRIGSGNETETHASKILKPGEQAKINSSRAGIQLVKNANMEAIMGWKSGVFLFDSTPLTKVMQQVSRWYNAKVEYVGTVPDVAFNGVIPRSSYASEVLKVLEMAGPLKFSIEEKKIRVQLKNAVRNQK